MGSTGQGRTHQAILRNDRRLQWGPQAEARCATWIRFFHAWACVCNRRGRVCAGISKKNPSRLPGNFKVGGYYNGGSVTEFAAAPAGPPKTERGRSGFCVVADQALVHWGNSTKDRHLGVFGALTAAPDQRVNRVPYFFDTGLVAYGPSSKRPRDFVGLAVVYGSYSRGLRLAEELNPAPVGVQNPR